MHVTGKPDLMRRVAVRIGLAALTLAAIVLVASPGSLMVQGAEPDGLQFTLRCTQTQAAPDSGGIGPLTCTLTVSGLPNPLEGQVSVTLFTADDPGGTPSGSAPSDTVVASEAPAIAPGAPVLVSRRLPVAPPPPPPISPQVPEQPPKRL